jgi:hypothetical protein
VRHLSASRIETRCLARSAPAVTDHRVIIIKSTRELQCVAVDKKTLHTFTAKCNVTASPVGSTAHVPRSGRRRRRLRPGSPRYAGGLDGACGSTIRAGLEKLKEPAGAAIEVFRSLDNRSQRSVDQHRSSSLIDKSIASDGCQPGFRRQTRRSRFLLILLYSQTEARCRAFRSNRR